MRAQRAKSDRRVASLRFGRRRTRISGSHLGCSFGNESQKRHLVRGFRPMASGKPFRPCRERTANGVTQSQGNAECGSIAPTGSFFFSCGVAPRRKTVRHCTTAARTKNSENKSRSAGYLTGWLAGWLWCRRQRHMSIVILGTVKFIRCSTAGSLLFGAENTGRQAISSQLGRTARAAA